MTSTPSDLLKDPLFQLNAVLWLTQPLPGDAGITPLLYQRGFMVHAIARPLAPPPDVWLAAQHAGIAMQQGVRPDVVLIRESDLKFAFTECKRSSSALGSSLPQGRTLFVLAGPRAAEILGLGPGQMADSVLAFAIPENERRPFAQTLLGLREELAEKKIPAGRFSVLGLAMTDTDVTVVINDVGTAFFGLPSGANPFMKREADTDPKPLYFIPYDPDVAQSEQERAFCKRVLFERMRSSVVAAIGRANPPAELLLKSQNILNDAMFGMYGQWENRDSAKHMRGLCRHFMGALMQALNAVVRETGFPQTMSFQPEEAWKITLRDPQQREKAIDALTRFSCETLDLRTEPEPDLFDDQENNVEAPNRP